MGQGPRTLAPRVSQSCEYRERAVQAKGVDCVGFKLPQREKERKEVREREKNAKYVIGVFFSGPNCLISSKNEIFLFLSLRFFLQEVFMKELVLIFVIILTRNGTLLSADDTSLSLQRFDDLKKLCASALLCICACLRAPSSRTLSSRDGTPECARGATLTS